MEYCFSSRERIELPVSLLWNPTKLWFRWICDKRHSKPPINSKHEYLQYSTNIAIKIKPVPWTTKRSKRYKLVKGKSVLFNNRFIGQTGISILKTYYFIFEWGHRQVTLTIIVKCIYIVTKVENMKFQWLTYCISRSNHLHRYPYFLS